MNAHFIWVTAFLTAGCASPVSNGDQSPDAVPEAALKGRCFAVIPAGQPVWDAPLPALIELSGDLAPGFVDSSRLAVREPGVREPRAPLSSWRPMGSGTIELVLGGGYTGYLFQLSQVTGGRWRGEGTYFADFGVDPTPPRLSVTLDPRTCP